MAGLTFLLPLDCELEQDEEDLESITEKTTLLNVETGNGNKEVVKPQTAQAKVDQTKKKKPALEKRSKIGIFRYTFRMIIFHIFVFLALFSALFATFHYGFDDKHKKIILQAVALLDDWKQLMFFFGIFLSFSVKKVGDVSSVSEFCDFIFEE